MRKYLAPRLSSARTIRETPTLPSDLRPAALTEGTAIARDGTRLGYTLHERGPGKPRAVLVHSLAMDRHFWTPLIEHLPASVLVYDCRGHGASGKPPGPYTVDLFARDLANLLDQVGWPSALVAGASMGGCIALAFAAAYPARTAALGLVDTTAWYGADAPKQWAERADRPCRPASLRWSSSRPRAGSAMGSERCTRTW